MVEDFIKVGLPDMQKSKAIFSFSTSKFSILTGDLLGASFPSFHRFYLFLAESQTGRGRSRQGRSYPPISTCLPNHENVQGKAPASVLTGLSNL
jgi:hypothetical protein